MRPKNDKLWEICLEIYRALYGAAEPSVDFDAVWKSYGKLQFYDKFYLAMDKQEYIMGEVLKTHKLTKRERDTITTTVWLGAAPSSVKES